MLFLLFVAACAVRFASSVRIFERFIASFLQSFEIGDTSWKRFTLETCLITRRLPKKWNTDSGIDNSVQIIPVETISTSPSGKVSVLPTPATSLQTGPMMHHIIGVPSNRHMKPVI